jgi:hypothetical protein
MSEREVARHSWSGRWTGTGGDRETRLSLWCLRVELDGWLSAQPAEERGARVAKQASGPDDQPMPEVEQVQAPPDWLDEVYQRRQSKRRR